MSKGTEIIELVAEGESLFEALFIDGFLLVGSPENYLLQIDRINYFE